ncbi:MAG: chorismate-binding protein [Actinobacteria bacterium]|nr:chorismate-binding protein [Actinomycetota bacterium]
MQVIPSREEFTRLAAEHTMVPVRVDVLGDRHTPVGVFERLAGDGPAFLLESVEGGERWARWSFAGWDPLFTVSSHAGEVAVEGDAPGPLEGDPLAVLEQVLEAFSTPDLPGLPPLHSGLVGYLGYDAVRYVERLPGMPADDRGLPEMAWQAVGTLAAVDRFAQTITLIRNVPTSGGDASGYDDAVARLARAVDALSSPDAGPVRQVPGFDRVPEPVPTPSREEFLAGVERALEHIRAGDAFQVVPSVRFEVPFDGDAFAVYRALRLVNPSPYLFYVRQGGVAIAGSSPELMVRSRDGRVHSRPIAGTRPRGADAAADAALAADLLADPKERAEHVMLVDLARNDLGRVSEYGSVRVDDLMVIERYSHVMHIVSGVSAALRPGVGPVDVLRATFPHGTVSGAPKVRAMEIIDTLEPFARGPYAGAVGYLDFSGNLDTAIALRTMVAAGGRAWVQAGAGIVADSVPEQEWEECRAKARAVLAAIGGAADV